MVKNNLDRLRAAHTIVAKLVVIDLVYLPIFKRLETEISAEEALAAGDPIAYARAVLAAQIVQNNQPHE